MTLTPQETEETLLKNLVWKSLVLQSFELVWKAFQSDLLAHPGLCSFKRLSLKSSRIHHSVGLVSPSNVIYPPSLYPPTIVFSNPLCFILPLPSCIPFYPFCLSLSLKGCSYMLKFRTSYLSFRRARIIVIHYHKTLLCLAQCSVVTILKVLVTILTKESIFLFLFCPRSQSLFLSHVQDIPDVQRRRLMFRVFQISLARTVSIS